MFFSSFLLSSRNSQVFLLLPHLLVIFLVMYFTYLLVFILHTTVCLLGLLETSARKVQTAWEHFDSLYCNNTIISVLFNYYSFIFVYIFGGPCNKPLSLMPH